MHCSSIVTVAIAYLALLINSSCSPISRPIPADKTVINVLYESGFEEAFTAFKKDRFLGFLVTSSVELHDSQRDLSGKLPSGKKVTVAAFQTDSLKNVSFLRIYGDGEYYGEFVLDKSLFASAVGGDAFVIKMLLGGALVVEPDLEYLEYKRNSSPMK